MASGVLRAYFARSMAVLLPLRYQYLKYLWKLNYKVSADTVKLKIVDYAALDEPALQLR